jgi:hypothetical protein
MKLIVYSDNNADYELENIYELNDLVKSYLEKENHNHEEDVYVEKFDACINVDYDEYPNFINTTDDEALKYPTWDLDEVIKMFEYMEVLDTIDLDKEEAYLEYCNNCGYIVSESEFSENLIGDKSDLKSYYEEFLVSDGLSKNLLYYFDMDMFLDDEESNGSFIQCGDYYFWG